jgi:hypothetical protein
MNLQCGGFGAPGFKAGSARMEQKPSQVVGKTVMLKPFLAVVATGAALLGAPAAAQAPRTPADARVAAIPPPLCRVWQRGLPADRQTPPTDCATARRQAAITGGQLIVGSGEPGGAFRVSEWPDRYRREADRIDARDREREARDRAIDERIRETEQSLRCVDEDDC